MVWEKVESNAHDFNGQPELIGVLKSKVPSQFEGNDYIVTTEEGKDVVVFGKAAIKSRLEGLGIGTRVKIVYNGMKVSARTNRKYADFEVFVDKDEPEVQNVG
jgi:hypothetical protein